MNDTLTKCPNCEARRKTRAPLWYECETHESCHYSKLFSPLCRERAARQKAEAEVQEQMSLRLDEIEQTETLEKNLTETEKERLDLSIKLLAANLNESKLAKQLSETRRKLEEALSVASMMRDESQKFRICASIHRDRQNNSAESVALRASELLDRFANHIKAAQKGGAS